jgi:hypothetical protein
MLEVDNKTPFVVAVVPSSDKTGSEHAIVIIKGTFSLDPGGGNPTVADDQVPIWFGDQHSGEPGVSSVKYGSDLSLRKLGTDVVLIGQAHAPRGKPVSRLDSSLQVGPAKKVVRVWGDRRWKKSLVGPKPTPPKPFVTIPLVYERAFGGSDTSHASPAKHDWFRPNPVGTGFAINKDRVEELRLPNLEDPRHPLEKFQDRAPPAGFGFIAADWWPRAQYAGTYDQAWQDTQAPFLPDDFDERFFHSATPELTTSRHLTGGEDALLINMSAGGTMRFSLPSLQLRNTIWIKRVATSDLPLLDTVVIEPDEGRLIVVWRTTINCGREFLFVDRIRTEIDRDVS